MRYLVLILAGMLLCNALPHLVSGVRGERFFTPWARPRGIGMSSAVENVLWGAGNLVAALALLRWIGARGVPGAALAIGLGFLAMGIGLALLFERRRQS